MNSARGQKDERIVTLRSLRNDAGRRRTGLFVVEGIELVRRALDSNIEILFILVADGFADSGEAEHLLDRAAGAGVETLSASPGLIAKCLESKPVPECLAIARQKLAPWDAMIGAGNALVQMVESCESADNLGMLLRSADAAGVSGVALSADTTDPFSRRAVRGSRGAVFSLPICIRADLVASVEQARKAKLQVVAASATAAIPHTSVDYRKPTMLIVGNEHKGISRAVRDASDAVVRIPMRGTVHSLNVAVACSVLLYEAVRQRSDSPDQPR